MSLDPAVELDASADGKSEKLGIFTRGVGEKNSEIGKFRLVRSGLPRINGYPTSPTASLWWSIADSSRIAAPG